MTKQTFWSYFPAFTLSVMLVLTPIMVLPLGDNFLKYSKEITVFVTSLLFLLAFTAVLLRQHILRVILSPFLLPLSLMLISAVASSLFVSEYPVTHFSGQGGILIILSLVGILAASVIKPKTEHLFTLSLSLTAVLASFFIALEQTGVSLSRSLLSIFGITVEGAVAFHPTGAALTTAQLALVALVVVGLTIAKSKRFKLWYMFSLPVMAAGLILSIWASLPGKVSSYLPTPLNATWSVAYSALKSPKTALIGVGP